LKKRLEEIFKLYLDKNINLAKTMSVEGKLIMEEGL